MEKAFKGFNHGMGQIDLSKYDQLTLMKPVEIHHKEDGSVTDKPIFCIVLTSPYNPTVAGQISLEMLNDGLADIGYEVVRKQK